MITDSRIFLKNVKWPLILFLGIFYLIFEILYAFKVNYFVSLSGRSLPLYVLFAYLIDWILVTFYMTIISIHTSYLLKKNVPWKRIIPRHLFFSILISFVIRLVIDSYQILIGVTSLQQYSWKIFIQGMIHSIDVNYLIYSAMIFIIYSFHYLNQVKISEKHKNLLEVQLLDTKIKMLTSQLQPHFLFNTLNSISSLIDIDQKKAQDTLADLSDFLRQTLYHMDSKLITVAKEIEILSPYLNILRTRFHDLIEIKLSIQEDAQDLEIPGIIIQPLIENAVKHGKVSSKGVLEIQLNIYSLDKRLIIEVQNSGDLLKNNDTISSEGMGLNNLKSRLVSIYGESAKLDIQKNQDMVKCTITIPI